MVKNIDDFSIILTDIARQVGAIILVIGGQSGSGKSQLKNHLLHIINAKNVHCWDLENIRDWILSSLSEEKQELYNLFRCSYLPIRKNFSAQLCKRVQQSAKALLKYYLWLDKVCRSLIMKGLQKQCPKKHFWLFELVSPIDSIWQIADLYVHLSPPSWRIERQLMKREGITHFEARNIRNLQENAIELNKKFKKHRTPDLKLLKSGRSEAIKIFEKLENI